MRGAAAVDNATVAGIEEAPLRSQEAIRTSLIAFAGIVAGFGAAAAIGFGGYDLPRTVLAATQVLEVSIGWSFIGVGLIAWHRRPDSHSGALMVLFGFAWLARLVGAIADPLSSVVGTVVGSLYLGVLVQLLVTFPSGRITETAQRRVVILGYAITAPLAVLQLTAGGAHPETSAPPGLLLGVVNTDVSPGQAVVDTVSTACVVIGLLAAAVLVIRRWRRSGPVSRRTNGPTLWSGVFIIGTIAVERFGALVGIPATTAVLLGWSARVVLLVWPVALLLGIVRSRWDESAIGAMITELGTARPMPDRLREVLTATLHDPTAQLGYWLPDRRAFADADGRPLQILPPRPGRAVTYLERGGEQVAALEYDSMLSDQPQLLEAVLAGIGLAVENERLRVEVQARIREVVASRTRIVEAAYAARRKVEHELHTGARRRLEAVDAALERLESESPTKAGQPLVDELDAISAELAVALDELRSLARGIYPVLLSDAGPIPAIQALLDRSPIPARLTASLDGRLPVPIEQAAYFLVLEAVDNAARHSGARLVTVEIRYNGDDLVVQVDDNGRGGTDPDGPGLQGMADRIAALGGTLVIESDAGAGTRVRAELPTLPTGETFEDSRVAPAR